MRVECVCLSVNMFFSLSQQRQSKISSVHKQPHHVDCIFLFVFWDITIIFRKTLKIIYLINKYRKKLHLCFLIGQCIYFFLRKLPKTLILLKKLQKYSFSLLSLSFAHVVTSIVLVEKNAQKTCIYIFRCIIFFVYCLLHCVNLSFLYYV